MLKFKLKTYVFLAIFFAIFSGFFSHFLHEIEILFNREIELGSDLNVAFRRENSNIIFVCGKTSQFCLYCKMRLFLATSKHCGYEFEVILHHLLRYGK